MYTIKHILIRGLLCLAVTAFPVPELINDNKDVQIKRLCRDIEYTNCVTSQAFRGGECARLVDIAPDKSQWKGAMGLSSYCLSGGTARCILHGNDRCTDGGMDYYNTTTGKPLTYMSFQNNRGEDNWTRAVRCFPGRA
ncbi:hypothetical protein EJ08DRAFT_477474 [Tothia fuscella]|uniref:Uncharacterized protein n=1 Tax=Tothia fuscella TaxID=1048955 RepID=A0A9P4NIL9_9PEZI|nr:hypothetical protein EJ08DRAFT_477474 [Tothia fuscella]